MTKTARALVVYRAGVRVEDRENGMASDWLQPMDVARILEEPSCMADFGLPHKIGGTTGIIKLMSNEGKTPNLRQEISGAYTLQELDEIKSRSVAWQEWVPEAYRRSAEATLSALYEEAKGLLTRVPGVNAVRVEHGEITAIVAV